MYSTPDPTHPHAKPTTNGILSAGISRIAQSHGQRFVAGDWNHDLDPLEAVDSLCALGLVEVQQLYFNAVGVRFSQRVSSSPSVINYLFLSPEVQSIFVKCTFHHDMWPDLSRVVAQHFQGGSAKLVHSLARTVFS